MLFQSDKMGLKTLVAFFLFLSILLCSAYNSAASVPSSLNPIWVKTWGGPYFDVAESVTSNSSSVYVTGYTPNGTAPQKAYILKYDINGNYLWNVTLTNPVTIIPFSIIIFNSSIYVTGIFQNGTNLDVFLTKISLSGDIIWNRTWGEKYDDWAFSLTGWNGGVYLTGDSCIDDNTNIHPELILIKYSEDGILQWNRSWSFGDDYYTRSILINNNSIFIAGSVGIPYLHDIPFISKCNLNGIPVWNKTWPTQQGPDIYSMSSDGNNIFLVGNILANHQHKIADDVLILKYDMNGNYIWNKTWNDNDNWDDESYSCIIYEQHLYVGGRALTTMGGALILKYDMNGTEEWDKIYQSNIDSFFYSLSINNSYIYAVGGTDDGYQHNCDFLILKTDLNGGNGVVPEYSMQIIPLCLFLAVFIIVYRKKR